MEETNICTLARQFSDEAAAWEAVEKMVWGVGGPVCPHCGDVGRAYFLKARSGQRTTKAGNVSYRRLWKCAACRKPFSVLVGTIFQDTKVPLSKWLLAIFMFVSAKNGVAAFELHRTLGVTNTTAWHMHHRIREAMKNAPVADMLRGTIVADETWFGGDPGNRHGSTKPQGPRPRTYEPITPGQRVRPDYRKTEKTPILSLVNADTGEVRSRVVADVTGATLRKVMSEHVDMAGSVLNTDEGGWYDQLGREFIAHNTVNHSVGEYVRNGASTNRAEGYFSQLKRSLDGTHHHISKKHLGRYLSEHDFRYSTCKISDTERMRMLMGQVGGRRLVYRTLVG